MELKKGTTTKGIHIF